MSRLRQAFFTLPVLAGLVSSCAPRSALGLTVFDPWNYQQNLLSAARALEQINNQVRQLQADAQILVRMDRNLQPLSSSIAPDLKRALGDIETRLHDGEGIALKLKETENAFEQLFPKETAAMLSADEALRKAKSRWEEEYASLKRAALLQGQIADSVGADTRFLDEALARSRNGKGALETAQAGNELIGLSVKQSLQLQSLLAAQQRSETVQRARDLVTEEQARQRFKSFLGNGTAYTASR
jgi:P-type conjugative transfer protein TrbJ